MPTAAVSSHALPTPAAHAAPPRRIARVCRNGHLLEASLTAHTAMGAPMNRADPLAVLDDSQRCATCGAGSLVACPGCGYGIPGADGGRPYLVPHFCIVCGEYYPWTFLGEFYSTLVEILEESPRIGTGVHDAIEMLERQRDGRATDPEVRQLTDTFRNLGGSDWDLAAQLLTVVLPAEQRANLDLRGEFSR